MNDKAGVSDVPAVAPDAFAMRVGEFMLQRLPGRHNIDGQSISGRACAGRAVLYEVSSNDGLRLTLRDVIWETGERDVAVWNRHNAPSRYDRLRQGLRLQVERNGDFHLELRQARLKTGEWSNLFSADKPALDTAAGADVGCLLKAAGATAVATREELFGDTGPARRRLRAVFPQGAEDVPAVAYVLTRIAPLKRRLKASDI